MFTPLPQVRADIEGTALFGEMVADAGLFLTSLGSADAALSTPSGASPRGPVGILRGREARHVRVRRTFNTFAGLQIPDCAPPGAGNTI